MLKKIIIVLLAASVPCTAQFRPDSAGKQKISTVKQVLEMADDSYVAVKGSIVKKTGKEKYLFQDSTGSVAVEIDDDVWKGTEVSPSDTVEITGEVDRDFFSVKVEADTVKKLQ